MLPLIRKHYRNVSESSRCCHNIVTSYNHHPKSALCACICADISMTFPRLLLNGLSSGAFLEVYNCFDMLQPIRHDSFFKRDIPVLPVKWSSIHLYLKMLTEVNCYL